MQKLVWQNSNGEEIDLTSGNYGITNWEGFANTSLNIQSQQVPFQDGGVFLDALMEQRELSVTLKMNDGGDLEERYRMRRELIHALNPKLGEGYLIYTNDFISKRIKCVAQIPLFPTHNSNDTGTPRASLSWTACEPYWEDLEETEINLINNERTIINNNGDVNTQIKAKIKMITSATNIILENDSEVIKINKTFSEDKILVINTNNGQKHISSFDIGYETIKTSRTFIIVQSTERNEYLAISGNIIGKSKDGKSWTYYKINSLSGSLIYADYIELLHKYVIMKVVYDGSTSYLFIYESINGIDWNLLDNSISTEGSMYECVVCYTEELNQFLVRIPQKIYISSDLTNWNEYNYETNYIIDEIIYAQNKYIGIGRDTSSNSFIVYSTDGITWVEESINIRFIRNICYSEELNIFVVLFANSQYFLTSEDGINWIQQDFGNILFTYINCIHYQNGYFLGIGIMRDGNNDYPVIIRSENGIIWEKMNNTDLTEKKGEITNYVYKNAMYVVGGHGIVSYSYNGYQYPQISEIINGKFKEIIYSNKQKVFLMVSRQQNVGSYISRSEDGVNWEQVYFNGRYFIGFIKYFEEKDIYLAVVTHFGYRCILVSNDGKNWELVFSNNDKCEITYICYSNFLNKFIAGGIKLNDNSHSLIISSKDGYNWNYEEQELDSNIKFICSSEMNRKIYAINQKGFVYSSTNGISWVKSSLSFIENTSLIFYVEYSKELNLFVALSRTINNVFEIYISKNTSNWSFVISLDNFYAEGIKWQNQQFLIYGYKDNDGGYYSSKDGYNWELKYINSETSINSTTYDKKNDIRYFTSEQSLLKEIKINEENVIGYIDAQSNMNLNLSVGENTLLARAESGKLLTKLFYRQKYIGV